MGPSSAPTNEIEDAERDDDDTVHDDDEDDTVASSSGGCYGGFAILK